jgi:hypothetical protein
MMRTWIGRLLIAAILLGGAIPAQSQRLLLLSGAGESAGTNDPPAIGTAVPGSVAPDFSSLTLSNVVVSGSNRAMAVCVLENTSQTVSSVTFNGSEALSSVVSGTSGSMTISFWYGHGLTATTADVVVQLTGSALGVTMIAVAIPLSNAQQSSVALSDTQQCSTCSNETVDLTSSVDNTLLLTCARDNNDAHTWTFGTGQTEIADVQEAAGVGESMGASYEVKGTAGVETLESIASSVTSSIVMIAMGVAHP